LKTLQATTLIEEGGVSLAVPESFSPSTKLPAFFNPKGKFVRDVSIACYNAFGVSKSGLTFADSLAGIGVRGLRVAKQVACVSQVFLNDVNPSAISLAKKSASTNNLLDKCSFSTSEVCSFLDTRAGGERFDIVDVDPFGTPSPFIDCAIRATKDGGMLSLAATDSAVLCGVYPSVAERKYLGRSLRTDYSHEVGLRLIIGLISMTAMRLETGIYPLFSHHDMHYFRVYVLMKVGNSHSRENEKKIGFIAHCFRCGYRAILPKGGLMENRPVNCPNCSNNTIKLGGPLWIGNIQSSDFVRTCSKQTPLEIFNEELDIPLYYDLTELSQKLHLRTPRINDVMARIQASGHLAGRTRLNPQALRTDAPLPELRSVVAELAR
jgi:tRNA (guanine26-N2/guanine27-N2)-dimethyltransferase